MPLFKGQGCKSTPSKAIDYIKDDKKAEIVSSQNLDNSRDYAEQFRETAQLFGKGTDFDERKYYSFKLSCDRADNVSASAHHEYAEAVAKRFFPNHECVIATHTDTDTVHSHIIVNAVNFEDGKKLQINDNKYRRMKDVADQMGVERGFSELNWRAATQEKRERLTKEPVPEPQKYSTAEKYIQQEHGMEWDKHSWKEQLRQVIDGAKKECSSRSEFQSYLKEYGVEMPRNTEKSVSFIHPLVSNKSVRGNVLGAEYTATEIDKALELNHERSIENARYDIKQNNIPERATETDSRTEAVRSGKRTSESRLDGIERKMRGISEEVHSLTSDGRAEQAERERAEAERAAAEQRRKQQESERMERAKQQAAERAKQQREQIKERESRVIEHDYDISR